MKEYILIVLALSAVRIAGAEEPRFKAGEDSLKFNIDIDDSERRNRRVNGSEKFWLESGGEAVLQIRAAYLNADDRASRLCASARPYQRVVVRNRPVS